jgi:hypothetical protein
VTKARNQEKMKVRLDEAEATDLVANPEEMEPELEHQEVLRKRPWWR